jgi:hypothetical protein
MEGEIGPAMFEHACNLGLEDRFEASVSQLSRRTLCALGQGQEPSVPGNAACEGRHVLTDRPQKITFGEMREMGERGILIYCADYKCSHSITMAADKWPMKSGCLTSKASSFARPAASAAPTYGPTSLQPEWE